MFRAHHSFFRTSFLFVFALFFSISAFAVTTPLDIPGSADVSRVEAPTFRPPVRRAAPDLVEPELKRKEASAKDRQTTFLLDDLVLDGNTVFSERQLMPLYRGYLGRVISFADLQDIAHDITVFYRNQGYILTRAIVPPQRIGKDGTARIVVIEGYIDHVSITGAPPAGIRDRLLAYGDRVIRAQPLSMKILERYALLANDLPGVYVRAVILPSKERTGAAELNFIVEQEEIARGYLSWDDRGSRFLGRHRYALGGHVNSFMGVAGRTAANYLTSVDFEQLNYIGVRHEQYFGAWGTWAEGLVDYSRTEPSGDLEDFDTQGHSASLILTIHHPVVRSRYHNANVIAGFRLQDTETDILDANLYTDRVRALFAGFSVEAADSLHGINLLAADVSQGILWLGATPTGFERSRESGRADATILHAHVSRLQQFGRHYSLLLDAEGQYAFQSLLSMDEFGFGGSRYGRAYDGSEIIGDRGLATKAEFRFDTLNIYRWINDVQFYIFYEYGKVKNINDPDQKVSESASDVGGGVRLFANEYLYSSLEYAKPLTRDVAAEGNRDARWFFNVTLSGDKR